MADAEDAIVTWRELARHAAAMRAEADMAWSRAMLATVRDVVLREQLRNDSQRKAYADHESIRQREVADVAEVDARAAELQARVTVARELGPMVVR